MDFSQLISERYSVRNFKQEHLPKAVINKILEASHLAPTGCNFQSHRILVLNTDESIEKLKGCTKCHFGAPTVLLICSNKDEGWTWRFDGANSAICDANIVTTYMMLAAWNEGVGSCWVMYFNPDAVRKAFELSDNLEPAALLVMGYPSDDAQPIDLHFKYRPMEEVVFWESFK